MEATARRAALLVAANAVQLPSAAAPDRGADAPPGPTVPTHGLSQAAPPRVQVRCAAAQARRGDGQNGGPRLPDIVQWFEEFCMSRMISPAVESPDGCYLRQRVSLSADEIERMLPLSCPLNWTFTSFFDILVEEEGNLVLAKTSMIDLLNLQLTVCEMLSEGKDWACIVRNADKLLHQCLESVRERTSLSLALNSSDTSAGADAAASECTAIERIYMRYMVEFGTVWHGGFVQAQGSAPGRQGYVSLSHSCTAVAAGRYAGFTEDRRGLSQSFLDFSSDRLLEWMDADMGAALPASSDATSSGGGAARSISGDAGGDEAPWLASMDQSAEFYDAAVGGAPLPHPRWLPQSQSTVSNHRIHS